MRVPGRVTYTCGRWPGDSEVRIAIAGWPDMPCGAAVTVTDEDLNVPQVGAALLAQARAHIDGEAEMHGSVVSRTLYHHVIGILHDLLAAVTTAPSPDAALDEATERAAEAWGVRRSEIVTWPGLNDGYGAGISREGKPMHYASMAGGPTRLAALQALAALATPKLKGLERMRYNELIAEIRERAGINYSLSAQDQVRALRARDGEE